MAKYSDTRYHLEPEVVEKLLGKLSSDENFRTSFQSDFFSALKSLGHVPPPDRPEGPGCDCPTELAPMEEIAAAHDALRDEYAAGGFFNQNMLVSPVGRKSTSKY
jgi:putative modified peptide